jgi:FAD/FMN-containing dehydrogenase/Fe-S oxidoreductase
MLPWQRALKERIDGEVRFDPTSKILYSTDASMYQIEPVGVVYPQHADDVAETIRVAYEFGIPVTPRGGGTSLAGQSVGKSIHIDTSRHMNALLEVNEKEHWARVQPGVVLDELNALLKPTGLMFAPDVAPSNRANVGGMIGNNSCGAHSVIYGKTIDHVLELKVVLSDGTQTTFGPTHDGEYADKVNAAGIEGRIYQEVRRIADENRDEIEQRFPNILRRVGGYNLDEFVNEGPFDLCKMAVGSEGTLVGVTEAKVNLVPVPTMTGLDVVHFSDLIEAMEATIEILKTNPAAVELVDKAILDLAKESIEASRQRVFIVGDPEAILVVEYYGESQDELAQKMDNLDAILKERDLGYASVRATTATEQANVWGVRKNGLGLLMGMKGDTKPATFVEDTAVSPEYLPEYISRFRQIVADHDTTATYYAHASVGTLHIRPLINLKSTEDIDKMRRIAEDIRDLVLEFGGAMSAEHGDGLVRSEWNEKVFGSKLYGAFGELKAIFDPKNIMNPGKIVGGQKMTEHLRFGPDYETEQINTFFDFSADGGFARSVELCNGVGACRKKLTGTMCPSYMATLDEEHSTRGRANMLRAALSGQLDDEGFTSHRLYEALDLCLECKGCKSECPSNVDMAKMKYEFLAHYYDKHGLPLRNRLFGHIASVSKVAAAFAPLSNMIMNSDINKWALDYFIGIDKRRNMPKFAHETFEAWFYARPKPTVEHDASTVVFYPDTFVNYNEPALGIATVEVLEKAGYRVILAEPRRCCGRPFISKGMLKEARAAAAFNIEHLSVYAERGWPIVGCEPSCLLSFRDDYLELVDDKRAQKVAEHVFLIDEFLVRENEAGRLNLDFKDIRQKIEVHGHCHQKALMGTGPTVAALNMVPGYDAEALNTGCCGMAGSFGYEREHYDLSLKIGGDRLFPAINGLDEHTVCAAPGTSCRHQISDGTGHSAKHPIEYIRDAME